MLFKIGPVPKRKKESKCPHVPFLGESQRLREGKVRQEREGMVVSLTRKICWVTQLQAPLRGLIQVFFKIDQAARFPKAKIKNRSCRTLMRTCGVCSWGSVWCKDRGCGISAGMAPSLSCVLVSYMTLGNLLKSLGLYFTICKARIIISSIQYHRRDEE